MADSDQETKQAQETAEETLSEGKTEAQEQLPAKAAEQETPEPTAKEPAYEPAPTKEKPAPTGKHADLIKAIEELSVADLAELVKALEERFGVAAAPIAAVPAGAPPPAAAASGQAAAAAPAGKATYTVHLAESGAQKIAVIKALREIRSDLGLKEAKDLVDGAPKDVAQNLPAEEAQKAKEKLEAAGAKVELR